MHGGRVEGSVALQFVSSSMTTIEAADRFLADLAATIGRIEQRITDELGDDPR
jgi:hypothetical protein